MRDPPRSADRETESWRFRERRSHSSTQMFYNQGRGDAEVTQLVRAEAAILGPAPVLTYQRGLASLFSHHCWPPLPLLLVSDTFFFFFKLYCGIINMQNTASFQGAHSFFFFPF